MEREDSLGAASRLIRGGGLPLSSLLQGLDSGALVNLAQTLSQEFQRRANTLEQTAKDLEQIVDPKLCDCGHPVSNHCRAPYAGAAFGCTEEARDGAVCGCRSALGHRACTHIRDLGGANCELRK